MQDVSNVKHLLVDPCNCEMGIHAIFSTIMFGFRFSVRNNHLRIKFTSLLFCFIVFKNMVFLGQDCQKHLTVMLPFIHLLALLGHRCEKMEILTKVEGTYTFVIETTE